MLIPSFEVLFTKKITFCACPLAVSECPLSVLERCPSYREFCYCQMTERRQGPSPGVRLIEVSIKRELTV